MIQLSYEAPQRAAIGNGVMGRRIFITGAAGFVGSAVVRALVQRGWRINALVNHHPLNQPGDIQSFPGGLFDKPVLDRAVQGCDAAIHLVGIIKENPAAEITFDRIHVQRTRAVVQAVQQAGVRRFIQMSAAGVREDAVSLYHQTKWQAEQMVRSSGLDWTIFRPSLIHGHGGPFMQQLARWARKQGPPWLFMPYFGKGLLGLGAKALLQPVLIDDVARAFVEALDNPKSIHHTYCLGGADRLTWPQMYREAAAQIAGRPRATLAIPAWWAQFLTMLVPSRLSFSRSQVQMSQEDNICDVDSFSADFGWTPLGFAESLAIYAKGL
jgi:NADH dehydrogenase